MNHVPAVPVAGKESTTRRDRATRRPVAFPARLAVAEGSVVDVRVVDLSYDGCQIDVAKALIDGEQVQLSVGGRGMIQATVRWCRGGRAGLKFAEEARPATAIKRNPNKNASGMPARLRRLGRLNYSVELRDLSPEGCMIDLVERPSLGEVMQLKLPGLETIPAHVRWIDNYVAGLKFDRPIHRAVFELLLERAGR